MMTTIRTDDQRRLDERGLGMGSGMEMETGRGDGEGRESCHASQWIDGIGNRIYVIIEVCYH